MKRIVSKYGAYIHCSSVNSKYTDISIKATDRAKLTGYLKYLLGCVSTSALARMMKQFYSMTGTSG